MSDKTEGPGLGSTSDGNTCPPESSSVSDQCPAAAEVAAQTTEDFRPRQSRGGDQVEKTAHVGPQFPDLFQKAMQGSPLADNVSVKYDGTDDHGRSMGRSMSGSNLYGASMNPGGSGGSGSVTAGALGTTFAAPPRRKWRRGH